MTDFKTLLQSLHNKQVDFVLVGGVAATAHGSSRLTEDIDIVYKRSSQNLKRLVEALKQYNPYLRGAPPGLPFEWSVETLKNGLNFTLVTDIGAIDLLGEIVGGGNFEQLVDHTLKIELFDRDFYCLNLQHLIHTKKAAGRPKDLEAIAELEAILEEKESSE